MNKIIKVYMKDWKVSTQLVWTNELIFGCQSNLKSNVTFLSDNTSLVNGLNDLNNLNNSCENFKTDKCEFYMVIIAYVELSISLTITIFIY